MLPLKRANKLRREADAVLNLIGLYVILRLYGNIYPSGSYFLDVMVYPDIDLYIPKLSLEQLFEIGAQIARCALVIQMVIEKTDDPVRLPEGLYLKPRVDNGDWGRPWKIDIRSLPQNVIVEKVAEIVHFQAGITPMLREQIIRYKLSILTPQKRTPLYSGYYIYKAFTDEGLTDDESVNRYLISCGVQVERSDPKITGQGFF
jgi:hypothetical protein